MSEPRTGVVAARGQSKEAGEPAPPGGRGLAEALVRRFGWTVLPGGEVQVVHSRRRYLLTPLVYGGVGSIFLGEWPGRPELPEWHARIRLHLRAAELSPEPVLICTDAAVTREVWGWRRVGTVTPTIYVEEHRAGDPERVLPFPPTSAATQSSVDDTGKVREGATAAGGALLRALRASRILSPLIRSRAGETPLATVVGAVERSRSPEVARGVWRTLHCLRVLDPACGGGEWLLGSLEALATVGLACLERMQAWVGSAQPELATRRRARYPDFERLLARRRELAAAGGRDRFAYESVLLSCIYGVAADAAGADTCQRRLSGRVPILVDRDDPSVSEALVDVRVGSLAEAGELRRALEAEWNLDPRFAGVALALQERAVALGRAEVQLRRLRLELGGSLEELAEGVREVGVRRQQLRAVVAGALRQRGSPSCLHPALEYPFIVREGGFAAIRRSDEAPVEMTGVEHAR